MLIGVAVCFALTPLTAAWAWARFFSPNKPGRDKNAIYECGLESKGDAWIQFRSEYYLYAIISIAQQASPKVSGHTEFARPQLYRSSKVVK